MIFIKNWLWLIFPITVAIIFYFSEVRGDLPEESTIDLSIIPEDRCGVWAQNVENVLNSADPMRALQLWMIVAPQDSMYMQVTYDYIQQSDIKESDNYFGTANSDCLLSHGNMEIGI